MIEAIALDFARNGVIVEIGSARETAGPDSSTCYFDQLARKLNATFLSIDFSAASNALAMTVVGDRAVLADGADFLHRYAEQRREPISVLYLDNFDVVYSEGHRKSLLNRVGEAYAIRNERITNERSAAVHMEQVEAALPALADSHVVIFDDTRRTDSGWWGKGATAVPTLLAKGYRIAAESSDGVLLTNPD